MEPTEASDGKKEKQKLDPISALSRALEKPLFAKAPLFGVGLLESSFWSSWRAGRGLTAARKPDTRLGMNSSQILACL